MSRKRCPAGFRRVNGKCVNKTIGRKGGIPYRGYTIKKKGEYYYPYMPSGTSMGNDPAIDLKTAKKWIDWDIYERE